MRATLFASMFAFAGLAACSSAPADKATGSTGAGASGAGTTGPSTTGAGGAGASGSGGGGGAPSFAGYARVDDGSAAAISGSADVGISPNGTIYVTWVVEQGAGRDAFVARSTDGGKTFGAAVKLDDDAIVPLVSMARHPYIEADDDRVAVVFNDQAGTIYLYVSDASGPLSFGAPTLVGGDITTTFRDFPKPLFVGGNLVVAWHGYAATGARIYLSSETNAYASEEASGGAPGIPCECCPIDLLAGPSGDVVVAFRNNDANIREMWSADAPPAGAFSTWKALSTSEGTVDTCPMQGPRLARTASGAELAVWSVRGQNSAGQVFLSQRAKPGDAWSGGASLAGLVGDEPTIAVTTSGKTFVTGVTGKDKSTMVTSDDGKTWSAPETLQTPDGTVSTPQAEAVGDIAAFAAVSSVGSVWLRRMQ